MKKVMLKIFNIFLFCALVQVPAFAANECSNEDNDAIAAEFALCSTHVYNIGETENQDGANRDLMRDVIAMKTTVMAQQLYKQYEQMESVLQRFKTQLEKAVLTDTLKAAGAKSEKEEASASFKSTTPNVYIEDMENCKNKISQKEIVECLTRNYNSLSDSVGNGKSVTREQKQQLASDYSYACDIRNEISGCEINATNSNNCCVKDTKCSKHTNITTKGFNKCLEELLSEIRKASTKLSDKERAATGFRIVQVP